MMELSFAINRCICNYGKIYWKQPGALNIFRNVFCSGFINCPVKGNVKTGPGLEYFIANSRQNRRIDERVTVHPYISEDTLNGSGRKVYFDVRGCQMNVSDVEIVWSILNAYNYERASAVEDADVALIMTCAIREGAEQKVWNRIENLKSLKKRRIAFGSGFKIGILGCMAERLKSELIKKENMVDLVAGPDSYRDLPRLLAITQEGHTAINVLLSLDETYADVVPLSLSENKISGFVSIMRGCDNMCSYCIVPFTRGKERSRPLYSIVDEVNYLSNRGIKEVTLLGQNVNSYRDVSLPVDSGTTVMARGFSTIYKPKSGGLRFADLLDKVSAVNPEMRIRFTSPHPKDFPDEVLKLIKERKNICKSIHLPAQSGSTRILKLMRRGYTKEAYCDLVEHIRSVIPDIHLTSDFICGFCSETEEDFEETLQLIKDVGYTFCYLFPYSLRERTYAHRNLEDNVPYDTKIKRLERMVCLFRQEMEKLHRQQIGHKQLVLVEGPSKRSEQKLAGRNDGNVKVLFPKAEVYDNLTNAKRVPVAGDYVEVLINGCSSQVLHGDSLLISSIESSAIL